MNQNNDVLFPFLNIVFWIFHNYVQARRKQLGIDNYFSQLNIADSQLRLVIILSHVIITKKVIVTLKTIKKVF